MSRLTLQFCPMPYCTLSSCNTWQVWNANRCTGMVGIFHLQGSAWDRTRRRFVFHDKAPPELSTTVRPIDVESFRNRASFTGPCGSQARTCMHLTFSAAFSSLKTSALHCSYLASCGGAFVPYACGILVTRGPSLLVTFCLCISGLHVNVAHDQH